MDKEEEEDQPSTSQQVSSWSIRVGYGRCRQYLNMFRSSWNMWRICIKRILDRRLALPLVEREVRVRLQWRKRLWWRLHRRRRLNQLRRYGDWKEWWSYRISIQDEEEEGAGDQSMLRRSSRKAAITANEGEQVIVWPYFEISSWAYQRWLWDTIYPFGMGMSISKYS